MVALRGVAFDLDGTLITSAHQVSRRMREVCRHLAEAGIWLTIASARPPKSVLRISDVISAQGPLCALNGAIVVATNGSILSRLSLPRTVASHLIGRFERDSRVSLNLYSGTDWIVQELDQRIQEEANVVGFAPAFLRLSSKISCAPPEGQHD